MASVITSDGKTVEIKKPNNEYWTKRAELSAQREYRTADKTFHKLNRIFFDASKSISKEISDFYTKYGINAQSPVFKTLEDGTQVVTSTSTKRIVPTTEAYKYKRLDNLQKQLNLILAEMAVNQNSYMITELRTLANSAYNHAWFDTFQGYGVGFGFNVLDPKVVTQIIKNPVMGQNFSERVWNNKRLLANQVNQELRNGITQGLATKEMAKRLDKRMTSGYKVAERLMITEISNTYNQATMQQYKDSGIVERYEYLATLDNRTSDTCQALDGQVFNIEDAVVGLNYPPMHVRCRSTTVAKFDNAVFERIARDPKTGNTYQVPSNMTYKEWAKTVSL